MLSWYYVYISSKPYTTLGAVIVRKKLRYHYLFPIIFCLGIIQQVVYHFYSGKFFPEYGEPIGISIFGTVAYCINPLMISNVQCPLVMKCLGDNGKMILPKNIPAPENA